MNGIRENIRKLYALADAIESRTNIFAANPGSDCIYPEELRVYANIARKIAEEIELEAKNASHD